VFKVDKTMHDYIKTKRYC